MLLKKCDSAQNYESVIDGGVHCFSFSTVNINNLDLSYNKNYLEAHFSPSE